MGADLKEAVLRLSQEIEEKRKAIFDERPNLGTPEGLRQEGRMAAFTWIGIDLDRIAHGGQPMLYTGGSTLIDMLRFLHAECNETIDKIKRLSGDDQYDKGSAEGAQYCRKRIEDLLNQ